MHRVFPRVLISLFALCLFGQKDDRTLRPQQATAQPATQEARMALVIGNGAYRDAPLRNPVNDARAMKEALEGCKFTVTLLQNAGKREMEDAIRAFGDTIRGGAVGLFYFAGHGVQVKGVNYLVPVGAKLDREDEVPYQAVEAGLVLDKMEAAKNRLNILILDACRNNPFARSWRSTGDKGLAQVKAPTGSLIAYATAPGSTAADGTGEHGLYTEALLAQMKEPGQELEKVFKKVREKVLSGSRHQQTPWESNSTVGDFYFHPLSTNLAGPTEAVVEATYWEGIENSRNSKDLDAFLLKFPNGKYAELAKAKLANLRRASEHRVISNLAEPWKAIKRDNLETEAEWVARVATLGPMKVGTAMVKVEFYDVDRHRLILPVMVDNWAEAYVKTRRVVLELDRAQLRQLMAEGGSATLATRFEIKEGRPHPGNLTIMTTEGSYTPSPELPPVVGAVLNSYGLWEAKARAGQANLSLVQLPADGFWMGETESRHDVTISRDFWMGKFPVTQGQWQAVMGNNPSVLKSSGADAPVEHVSWDETQRFITRVNGMQREWTFRLPTEAEWEYACRAGTMDERYGDLDAIAWYKLNSEETTHPVGQKQPNAFGLYDMLGNVWQWCQDRFGFFTADSVTDPQGPSKGDDRVSRGGSWLQDASYVRSASRSNNAPDERWSNLGFRVVAMARTP